MMSAVEVPVATRCCSRPAICACVIFSILSIILYFMVGRTPISVLINGTPTGTGLSGTDSASSNNTPNYLSGNNSGINRTKVILFWSQWYSSDIWFNLHESDMGRTMFNSKYCTHSNCLLTTDHSKLKEADLLMFYYGDAPNWPTVRYPYQYYAHFIHEPPGDRTTFLDKYEGKINVTINFRRDADMYIPYNKMLPVKNTSSKYVPRIPLSSKIKMALWPVSHCQTSSHREQYVKELSKYMAVDIYGGCGSHRCPRSRTHGCLQDWEKTYKFYLSFENNICEDYITEKMFQPLRYELIPVVLGGGNYTADAPPHSVIDARDFASPKALAEFLIELGSDEQRYNSYFQWKPHFELVTMPPWIMCRLCEALHEDTLPKGAASTHYGDYWYGRHNEKCDNALMARMRKSGGW